MSRRDYSLTEVMLISFLVGGIVGAGLALLFAPQSGTVTRKKIMDMAEDVKDTALDYTEKVKKKVSSAF